MKPLDVEGVRRLVTVKTLGNDRRVVIEGVVAALADLIRQEPDPDVACDNARHLLAEKVRG